VDLQVHLHLAEILDDVVSKRIVVVDHQDHWGMINDEGRRMQ
jgi:hypothetical protein